MINWELLTVRNIVTIGAICLIWHFVAGRIVNNALTPEN